MNTKVGAKLLAAVFCLVACPSLPGRPSAERVRQAAVAGPFYPANAKELAAMVDGFLAQAKVPAHKGDVVALVAPHAGYPFSGAVAGHSYALLKGRPTHRVIVIAPSHFESFSFTSVYDGDAYATPLGTVPVDKEFVRKLVKLDRHSRLSTQGHSPTSAGPEHSLEDQLPFLQRVLGDFQLVPIVMGEQSYGASRSLGIALAELIRETDTLIVASSDLSHYHSYDQAVTIDRKTLGAIGQWDYLTLSDNFATRVWEACGGAPIVTAMIASERLGAKQALVTRYANSGDVTGDRTRVVGYGAIALLTEGESRARQISGFSLTLAEKRKLLEIAKKSVESAVRDRKVYRLPEDLPPSLAQDRAGFVTLMEDGELRGCIGHTVAMQPLAETVRDVAALAALHDRRFRPVTPSELPKLAYEISVLSPMRRVANTKDIKIGEHGLMIVKGDTRGLLLPQVAVEQRWDRSTFLDETAMKAGLPASAWRDSDADLFAFTAVVFGDTAMSRELIPKQSPVLPNPPERPTEPAPGLAPR